MNKKMEIEKKLYEIFDELEENFAINWYAVGSNFISWDITPLKSMNKNIINIVSSLCFDIAKKMSFYCCPETMVLENKIRINFFY